MSVRKVSDIRRYLEHYVKNDLFHGKTIPSKTRCRYFPRRKDIANEISKIKQAKRFTQVDQDHLKELVTNWRVQKPNDNFFFRAQENIDCADGYSSGSEIDDDIDDLRCKPTRELQNNLLFCYQSEQQCRLLAHYGNAMCLLDATYRTTRYALPLFFLCVRTNVGCQVVGVFIIQQEDIESINAALEIFKVGIQNVNQKTSW